MPGSVLKAGARKLIYENSPGLFFISIVYIFFATVVFEFSFRIPFGIVLQEMTNQLAVGELPDISVVYKGFRPIGLISALLLSLLRPVFEVGYISYCLKTSRIQPTELKDIFKGFLFFTKILSIFILTTTIVFLWSLLFIIPGIVASLKYRLAYYILLDDPRKSVFQCITESRLLMHGRKLDLLIIDISFLGWYLLEIIVIILIPVPFTIPVISIWIIPYIGLTRAAFYEDQVTYIAV